MATKPRPTGRQWALIIAGAVVGAVIGFGLIGGGAIGGAITGVGAAIGAIPYSRAVREARDRS